MTQKLVFESKVRGKVYQLRLYIDLQTGEYYYSQAPLNRASTPKLNVLTDQFQLRRVCASWSR